MWHRTPIPDLLIAETALHHAMGVVTVDRDFERIAEVRPLVVRRLLELHRERLEEWLEAQQRLLANIEGRRSDGDRRGAPDDLYRADRGADAAGARAERAGTRSS